MATKTKDRPAQERLELEIEGMHCASCVSRVEGSLAETPGVLSASVTLASAEASVAYEPGRVTVVVNALRLRAFRARAISPEPI